MINRFGLEKINEWLLQFPVIGIIGPRQVGKTTLVKKLIKTPSIYLDLESDLDLAKLSDPGLFLRSNADKCIILDEVQRMQELFPLLRAIIDEDRRPGRFILLGSASPALLRSSSESLAGRIGYFELTSFCLQEVGFDHLIELWVRGGFPESFLARSDKASLDWRNQFILSYIERELPLLGLDIDRKTLSNFLRMLANGCSQLWNATSYGKSLGLTSPTVKKYLDFLENAFLIEVLQPFHTNLKKRLVKTPKVYFKDTGILHALLNIQDYNGLQGNLAIGASWENFVIEQIKNSIDGNFEFAFYRTHEGTEADLVILEGGKPIALLEIKYTNAPKLSKGFFIAIEDLKTDKNFVITPSSDTYPVHEKIRVMSLGGFLKDSPLLVGLTGEQKAFIKKKCEAFADLKKKFDNTKISDGRRIEELNMSVQKLSEFPSWFFKNTQEIRYLKLIKSFVTDMGVALATKNNQLLELAKSDFEKHSNDLEKMLELAKKKAI